MKVVLDRRRYEAIVYALPADGTNPGASQSALGFDVAIGMIRTDQALVDRVNAILNELAESGVIAATLGRCGIPGTGQ